MGDLTLFDDAERRVSAGVMHRRNAARYYGRGRDWETPAEIFDPLNEEFCFTLDPCATPATAKCVRYYTQADDGLAQSWAGERVFMNPPYGGELYRWTRKAMTEAQRGALVVGLLPASTDLAWWHEDIVNVGAEIRYVRGRIKFWQGERWASPFTPSVVVVWRSRWPTITDGGQLV